MTKLISTKGIKAVYESFGPQEQKTFIAAYAAAYKPTMDIHYECYQEARLARVPRLAW